MSSFIKINSLCFGFNNLKSELFTDLEASFHEGWNSICGANGCGKTTFIKIICGDLKAVSGKVQVQGKLVSVAQSTEHPPKTLEDFRWEYSKAAIKIREKLGILDDWFDRWETLSIGERKRLQLAVALTSSPDILLIDEPTNHVDAPTRMQILSALAGFKGVGILVSHDRLLLNELCTKTFFLHAAAMRSYGAPYDVAKNQFEEESENKSAQKDRLKKDQVNLAKSAQSQVEKIAQGKKKLSKRGISSKDHDAKEKINRAKLFGAGLADSRKKLILSRRSEKISEEIKALQIKKTYDLGVFFTDLPRVKNIYLEKAELNFPYLTIEQPEVGLSQGDKLAIVGANGAGKSTLLGFWLKKIKQNYAYAPQEFSAEETKLLTEELLSMEKDKRGEVFTLISCLGSSPKSIAAGSIPSPGVWQKVMIAKAIVNKVPVLILDEPTNHMDLPSLEVLEEALKKFQGIMVCISHDQDFVENICNLRLKLEKKEGRSEGILSYIDGD